MARPRMEIQELIVLNRFKQLPTVTCPNCMMVWLAPGVSQGDSYECRSCHLSFVVRGTCLGTSPHVSDDAATASVQTRIVS